MTWIDHTHIDSCEFCLQKSPATRDLIESIPAWPASKEGMILYEPWGEHEGLSCAIWTRGKHGVPSGGYKVFDSKCSSAAVY